MMMNTNPMMFSPMAFAPPNLMNTLYPLNPTMNTNPMNMPQPMNALHPLSPTMNTNPMNMPQPMHPEPVETYSKR
ncbi:hypothetical protein PtB15_2B189 [Puccinia triticina]|nr:hypothetical protein PtB15_2B189 [Puccinia triticina]